MYYPCSENKGADQLRGYREALICVFVFAYADCWFSHWAAQIIKPLLGITLNYSLYFQTSKSSGRLMIFCAYITPLSDYILMTEFRKSHKTSVKRTSLSICFKASQIIRLYASQLYGVRN